MWRVLVPLAVLVGLPARAAAQVVQGCQPNQYLDRTASGADRRLNWDFGIGSDPERCLQVQTGQTVIWDGELEPHPLGGQGGDTPNPITSHQDGSVSFNTPGTFGYICLAHSSMKGAIKVVLAPPQPAAAPALSRWLTVVMTILLLASGLVLLRNRRLLRAAAGL